MVKHFEIKISGKVQGVFFRVSAKHEAERLGLTGFAKNCEDGSVCIEAEGDEVALREFLVWCREGPEGARVENIEFRFINEPKDFGSFEIL